MSGPAFTPGPWLIDDQANPYSPPSIVVGVQDTVLAEVFGDDDIDEECRANARLIAAAPELYEALEAALSKLGMPDGYFGSIGEPITRQMRRALAKARGEQ